VAAGRHDEDLARCWPRRISVKSPRQGNCSAPRHWIRASLKTGVLKSLRTPLSAVASVIHTAKLKEIEPLAHRRDVLKRIVSTRTKASELRFIVHLRRRIRGRFY